MSVHRTRRKDGATVFVVRWREGDTNRQRTFDRRRDAELYDGEVRRRRQLGSLHTLDAGSETLHEYVTQVWGPAFLRDLAPRTRELYADLYDRLVQPYLGSTSLRELTPETIARWQSDRLGAGTGRESVRKAFTLLGSILQRAHEAQRIVSNPQRLVRKAKASRREEVRPLAPATVEAMRAHLLDGGSRHPLRDATLLSVLAYAGLRPGEALALRWGDVSEHSLLVQRAVALGAEKGTKTGRNRTVRLLDPLRRDLAMWRLASGRPDHRALVFPADDGGVWTREAYGSWRRRAFASAATAAGAEDAHPYALRHSFASLLLHEGRGVPYVARQLGHGAALTLGTYGHVMDDLDASPNQPAEAAIVAARKALVRVSFAPAVEQIG